MGGTSPHTDCPYSAKLPPSLTFICKHNKKESTDVLRVEEGFRKKHKNMEFCLLDNTSSLCFWNIGPNTGEKCTMEYKILQRENKYTYRFT